MEFTVEQELQARIFLHKVAIVKSTLAHAYIAGEKKKGGIMLSDNFLEEQALNFANITLQNLLYVGKLDEAYEEAWNIAVDHLPDNFGICIGEE